MPDTTRDDAFSGFLVFTVVFARRKAMAPARLNPAPAIAKRTTSETRIVVGIASATVADDMSHIAAAKIAATMGGGTLSASVTCWLCDGLTSVYAAVGDKGFLFA